MKRIHKIARIHFLIILLAAVSLAASASESITIKGKTVALETSVGEDTLQLQGADLLRIWGFKVYVASCYLPTATTPKTALDAKTSRVLELQYFRDIAKEDFIKAADSYLKKNPDNDLASLQDRLDQLNAWYRPVKAGDVYRLEYASERGTTLIYNGQPLGTIPGSDFAEAYFGIWLSEYCLNDELRQSLLGMD